MTSGYLGCINDEQNKDGNEQPVKGLLDTLLSSEFEILALHPILLPTLILDSLCNYYDVSLHGSRIMLRDIESIAQKMEQMLNDQQSALFDLNRSKKEIGYLGHLRAKNSLLLQRKSLLNDLFPFIKTLNSSCLAALPTASSLAEKVDNFEEEIKIRAVIEKTIDEEISALVSAALAEKEKEKKDGTMEKVRSILKTSNETIESLIKRKSPEGFRLTENELKAFLLYLGGRLDTFDNRRERTLDLMTNAFGEVR